MLVVFTVIVTLAAIIGLCRKSCRDFVASLRKRFSGKVFQTVRLPSGDQKSLLDQGLKITLKCPTSHPRGAKLIYTP